MGMIDRYRKKGGFIQLLNLIETTGGAKQEKFLKLISDENALWETEVRKKMLTVDRVAGWPTNFLMEIMPKIPALALAFAIFPLSTEKRAAILKAVSHIEKRKIEEHLNDNKTPPAGEVQASQIRIINEIRAMVAAHQLKFEKFDADLVIPENIEEVLNSGVAIISEKDLAQHFEAVPAGTPINLSDELTQLRKKVVQLMQDNTRLSQQNTEMKDKLEQIKKIA